MFSWMGLLEASAAGGICIVLFFLLSQLFGERYSAKYRRLVWILIAVRMCVPVCASLLPRPLTVQVPNLVLGERRISGEDMDSAPAGAASAGNGQADSPALAEGAAGHDGSKDREGNKMQNDTAAGQTDSSGLLTAQDVLFMLWVWGCAGVLAYYLSVHFVFCRRMARKSRACTDEGIQAMAADIAKELGMRKAPRIRMTRNSQTGPFTVGFLRSTVFLPDDGYEERDLRYIVKHELAHCAGKDTQLKALLITVNALHWFNPLAWFMKAMADQDMELACDERVLRDCSGKERNEYSEVLLSCIGTDKAGRSVLSTGYVQGVKFIKKRFRNIFNIRRKSGGAAVCVLMAVLMAVSGLVGFEAGRTVYANGGTAEEPISDSQRTEQNKAYGAILWNVYYLGQIEGIQYAFPDSEGNGNGSFAIYDIDGDGYDELLLCFDGGTMASTVEYIWGYKNGSTHVELCEFPKMSYYDNGIIEADWSHNQGLAGDFWPYSVYMYNSERDEYQKFGAVDAWDKISTEVTEHFPDSIDADRDGIVYYILPADWDGHYERTPVDGKDYENWKKDYLHNAEEMEDIPFKILNEENIAKLGATKPDIQFPEPAG